MQTWEQKRWKDFISLGLARHSKHLLNFDNAGSVIARIGEVLGRKVKYIPSNTTQFFDLVRMSIADALVYLQQLKNISDDS